MARGNGSGSSKFADRRSVVAQAETAVAISERKMQRMTNPVFERGDTSRILTRLRQDRTTVSDHYGNTGSLHVHHALGSAFQLRLEVVHELAHLSAWAEFDRLVVFVDPYGVPRWPVVDFAGVHRFLGAVRIGHVD